MGSPTVLINNMMACRLGDIVVEKPGLALGPVNPIIMGEMTVMIGEVGMGSPVMPSSPLASMSPMMVLAKAMNSVPAQALAQAAQAGTPFIEPCPG